MLKTPRNPVFFLGFWVSNSSSFGRKNAHIPGSKNHSPNITGSPPERGAMILPRLLDLLVSPAPQMVIMG